MARVFISHSSRDNEAARRIKHWLHEQGFDTPFLDFDKHAGIPPGADWERTLYQEIEQSQAIVIIQTPNWMESKWCFAEFTQARALGKAIFPIIETPVGDTLIAPDIQSLDLQKDREGGFERLSQQLTQLAFDAQGGFDWDRKRSPYPGLLAFQQEDAAIYFGRDDDIRRFIERLNARRTQGGTRLIALLGASGSGKSSLLRAGVIPRLRRAGRNWIIIPPMLPKLRPVDELARALAVACDRGSDWRQLRDDLRSGDLPHVLSDIGGDLRIKHGANDAKILIPVDQGEELFTAAEPEQGKRFCEILNEALSGAYPFMCVLAMRSDHLGDLQAAPYLSSRFEEFSLGPMPLARIAQIIEGPARVAGLQVEEELVHQAVSDAETEDALPLLAFALRELYDRYGSDKKLSLDEYKALGDERGGLTPLENSVRKAADEVLKEAAPAEDALLALRDAFVPAMVRVNEQGDYIRQRANWNELPAKAHPLLERLATARLLIISQDGEQRVVEVAHEALLRKWPRLRAWLDESREFLTGKQQLVRDLQDWEQAPESAKTGALLTGLKLSRARGWMLERPHQLSAAERSFIQHSVDHVDAEEQRKIRQRKNITRASVAAAVVLAVAAVFSGYQWLIAQIAADDLRRAADERAAELVHFAWSDLGAKQEEAFRLGSVARSLGQEERLLVPDVLDKPQADGFDCKTYLESGFRHLYCSVRNIIGFEKIRSIAGLNIFLPGSPHESELNFSDPVRFGHYNPEFLSWLEQYIIPYSQNDPKYNELTQLVYDTHIGPLARALYNSHRILFASPEAFADFEQHYQTVAKDYTGRLNRGEANEMRFGSDLIAFDAVINAYRQHLDSGARENFNIGEEFRWLADYLATDKGDDWYLANTTGGFWVRRHLDGTEAQIFGLVARLLENFEPQALADDL
jgi:hypothetical protein